MLLVLFLSSQPQRRHPSHKFSGVPACHHPPLLLSLLFFSPASPEHPYVQVFPRAASRPPRLLQELQALLVDRLRVNDRLASTSTLLAKERDPGMAANLLLDGHRQVCAPVFCSLSCLLCIFLWCPSPC